MIVVPITMALAAVQPAADDIALEFSCSVIGADGTTSQFSGNTVDSPTSHPRGGTYIRRAMELVDHGATQSGSFNLDLRQSAFILEVGIPPAKENVSTGTILAIPNTRRYFFDGIWADKEEVAVKVETSWQPRPAVYTKRKLEVAGICTLRTKDDVQ